jgi:hypothetical protein
MSVLCAADLGGPSGLWELVPGARFLWVLESARGEFTPPFKPTLFPFVWFSSRYAQGVVELHGPFFVFS